MNNPVTNLSDRTTNNNNGANNFPLNAHSLLQPYAQHQQQQFMNQQQHQQQQSSNQLQLAHLPRERNQSHEMFYDEEDYVNLIFLWLISSLKKRQKRVVTLYLPLCSPIQIFSSETF